MNETGRLSGPVAPKADHNAACVRVEADRPAMQLRHPPREGEAEFRLDRPAAAPCGPYDDVFALDHRPRGQDAALAGAGRAGG
jgi:hypothetical protein